MTPLFRDRLSLALCFVRGVWLSVEKQSPSHKLSHGWRADSSVGACLYGRTSNIWPQLPRRPRTTTRVVAAVCPRFHSMPAGTAAAKLQQYLGSTLPLASAPVHISCQPHSVLLYTHSIHTSTSLLPGPTATSHPPAFPATAPCFTCTAIPNPAPSWHSHTSMLPQSNPTIDIDSCETFVGRLVGGVRSSQPGGRIAHFASQA